MEKRGGKARYKNEQRAERRNGGCDHNKIKMKQKESKGLGKTSRNKIRKVKKYKRIEAKQINAGN